MKVIQFTAEGLVNSFRRIETASFQNTELTPKKTHIAGMITNVMGKTEQFYYNFLSKIKVGIVPLQVDNIFIDLWQYKKWKSANYGRAVVKRERLYHPEYKIYIYIPKEYRDEVLQSLKRPKRPPALGLDDELVLIKDVGIRDIKILNEKKVNIYSIFPEDYVEKYTFSPRANTLMIPPRTVVTNLSFERGPPRKAQGTTSVVEFFGGYCRVTLKDGVSAYSDGNTNVIMW